MVFTFLIEMVNDGFKEQTAQGAMVVQDGGYPEDTGGVFGILQLVRGLKVGHGLTGASEDLEVFGGLQLGAHGQEEESRFPLFPGALKEDIGIQTEVIDGAFLGGLPEGHPIEPDHVESGIRAESESAFGGGEDFVITTFEDGEVSVWEFLTEGAGFGSYHFLRGATIGVFGGLNAGVFLFLREGKVRTRRAIFHDDVFRNFGLDGALGCEGIFLELKEWARERQDSEFGLGFICPSGGNPVTNEVMDFPFAGGLGEQGDNGSEVIIGGTLTGTLT